MDNNMFVSDNLKTFYDTPDRSTPEELKQKKDFIEKHELVLKLLNGIPNPSVLLDENRQIVAYNKAAEGLFTVDENNLIIGRRVGEAVNCIHSFDMPAGCGTSKFCEECGAGQANKCTRETLESVSNECRITTKKDNVETALDLRVHTSIFEIEDRRFTLFTIEDIQNEKRRKVLERIFFHDVLNTAGAVRGIAEVIKQADSFEEVVEFKDMILNSSDQLIREIQSQRDLINAENGTLSINSETKSINDILKTAYNIYKEHKLSNSKNYLCDYSEEAFRVSTDMALLIRSLGNLIKNALEATDNGGTVKIFADKKDERVLISVYNDKVIPENIQLQIFQRSFSTKAKYGRGIGTYSVKLLVENYLKGKVYFRSNEKSGTVFVIDIPIDLNSLKKF